MVRVRTTSARGRSPSRGRLIVGFVGGSILSCLSLFLLPILLPGSALAESTSATSTSTLSLEQIMADPAWLGREPLDPYWAVDSRAVYFERQRPGSELRDLFRLDLASGHIEPISDSERGSADAPAGELDSQRRLRVSTHAGDLFVHDLVNGDLLQLTRTSEPETDPHFMADGESIVFSRGETLFVRHLPSGLESQPVELRLEKDPAEEEDAAYLGEQDLRLFDYLRKEKADREAERQRERDARRSDPTRPGPTWYLGDKVQIQHQALSPRGDRLLVLTRDAAYDEGRKDHMPRFVHESAYVAIEEVREKVGTGDPLDEQLLLLDLTTHTQHALDLAELPGITEDPLAELRREAARRASEKKAEKETGKDSKKTDEPEEPAKPRPVEVEQILWHPDGRYAALQLHSWDNKDRWIAILDGDQSDAPRLRSIHHLSDPQGWINWSFNEMGWLRGRPALYFLSEESGYSQLYLHSLEDGSTRRLTHGEWVVAEPAPDPDERYIYYQANATHPGIYEVYRVELASGRNEQITRLGGNNDFALSPDGKKVLLTHSTTLRPPELYLQAAQPGAEARRLTETISAEFTAIPWVAPEIVAVSSRHQERPIYSRLYLPPNEVVATQDAEQRPAVIFVHGAGYLQNAHQGWSTYFREFMFHTWLTRHGYVVLDMDYRGSAGYGRDWRTAIYRHMGQSELEDLEDGVAWLVDEHRVDPRRVGVYGGSYGGFIALMALFKEPDLFACGAALRPVTDWAHYNHGYTSNILNTPDIDPEAYQRSSPIELASGLTKPLLICAPMLDDNVFFQDTVRLVQRLIELEKESWEVAIYPVEPHGFRQPSSWLDEYRRIFKLFETHLWP